MQHGKKYRMKRTVTKRVAVKRFENNIDIFIQKLIYEYGYNLPCVGFEECKFNVLWHLKKEYMRDYDGVSQE